MIFPKESPFPVYCRECWWSDKWDAVSYGKDFDFSKSFFEQYHELLKTVPSIGIVKQGNNINSEYANRSSDNKNSYLVFGSNANENINYGSWINDSRDSMDCFSLFKSENCYECVDCVNSPNLFYSI